MNEQWEELHTTLDECAKIDKEIEQFELAERNAHAMVTQKKVDLGRVESSLTEKSIKEIAKLLTLIARVVQFENATLTTTGIEKPVYVEPFQWGNNFNIHTLQLDKISIYSRDGKQVNFAVKKTNNQVFDFMATVPVEFFSLEEEEITAFIAKKIQAAFDARKIEESEFELTGLEHGLVDARKEVERKSQQVVELENRIKNLKNLTKQK